MIKDVYIKIPQITEHITMNNVNTFGTISEKWSVNFSYIIETIFTYFKSRIHSYWENIPMYLEGVSYVVTFCPLKNSMGFNFIYTLLLKWYFIQIYRKNYLSIYI